MENAATEPQNFINLIVFFVMMALLLAVTVVFIYTYSKKRILNEEVKRSELELRHKTELLHAVLMAQEEERQNIARDLHDEIGANLTIIYQGASRLADVSGNGEYAGILSLTSKTIQSTRRISHQLLPPVLKEFGLAAALRELFEDVAIGGRVKTKCTAEINENGLNGEQKLNIFRISQELVNNSLKHGEATEITLELAESGKGLYYSYKDNGKGFDMAKAGKGLGLKNIENRAEMLNASLKYKTEQGKGVGVLILVKYPA
ncbi:MAG TPA: sensor histidine kinase [Bacteroidia bacterium]|nr:sensor histidine kinase [Bacteroidia bacterium]